MIIAHTCTQCGHADFHRDDRRGGRTAYCPEPCTCKNCTPGEPTLRPTFDGNDQVIERIIPPGESGGYIVACACAECKALFEQLTEMASAT